MNFLRRPLLADLRRPIYHEPVIRGRPSYPRRKALGSLGLLSGLAALALLLGPTAADAYPYMDLRPGGQALSGPTDGELGAVHFNPAAIRLYPGSQIMAVAGVNSYLGSYQRSTPLPTGFTPGISTPTSADPAAITWVNPDAMAAASWDLRTDAVTLGFGFYTPHMDFSNYGQGPNPGPNNPELTKLSTRYHLVAAQTYSLWGTVAVALRLRPWLYFGGAFNFAYTRSHEFFYRDLDPNNRDNFSCGSSPETCERWENRLAIETDVANFGYGFSAGALLVPLEDRLFIGLSYISPLLTPRGDEVGLGGLPDRAPFQAAPGPGNTANLGSDPCAGSPYGARLTRGDLTPSCGSALLSIAFPHIVYLGVRGRRAIYSWSRYAPSSVELTAWARLMIPPRQGTELNLEKRIFPQGLLALPLSLQPAVAVTFGVREHWRRLTLGEELLYESPRTDPTAVSPANLEGHKLDASFAMRLHLRRQLSFLLTVGATYVFFAPDSGTRYSASDAQACRAADYDISSPSCLLTQIGWAVPQAPGSYQLVIAHGVAGFELNL